jgi:hypothetical protein
VITYELETKEKLMFIIPVFGWVFLAFGMAIWPIENVIIYWMWWIDAVLSATHFFQIFVALPYGKKAGIPAVKTVFMTIALGSTWWKPLKKNVDKLK